MYVHYAGLKVFRFSSEDNNNNIINNYNNNNINNNKCEFIIKTVWILFLIVLNRREKHNYICP